MKKEKPEFQNSAITLREAFDGSFALPATEQSEETRDFLSIRIAGDPYALSVSEMAGIVARRAIVPVPAAAPGFLGLAGIRGQIVPVFGLSALLGYGTDDLPTWIVLCAAQAPIALGFSEFEGHLRLPKSALHAGEALHSLKPAGQYVDQVAMTDAGARPVLEIRRLLVGIRSRLGAGPPRKEE